MMLAFLAITTFVVHMKIISRLGQAKVNLHQGILCNNIKMTIIIYILNLSQIFRETFIFPQNSYMMLSVFSAKLFSPLESLI